MTNPNPTAPEAPVLKRGRGRPPKESTLPRRNIRMDDADWQYILDHGGTPFIRTLIRNHQALGKQT